MEKLHRIPHLRLPLNFDAHLLKKELEVIEEWTPHSHAGFRDIPEEQMRNFSKGYSGVSLYEFNGQMKYATDNYEIFEGKEPSVQIDPNTGHVLFFSTELVPKMPYTAGVVDTISKRKGRTRIMRSEPNHSIVWHSHNRGPWFNEYMQEGIIHVPIITDPAVIHAVCDYRLPQAQTQKFGKSRYDNILNDSNVYCKNYSEGECWLFNSWHDHYYHNYSSKVRYSLLLYIRWFNNDDFVDLIEEAMSQYNGPLLQPD
jgi:hypothetical protein